jgi:DHA1 family bicyclomycin/chloramphenicol resistance-like MFS transporter
MLPRRQVMLGYAIMALGCVLGLVYNLAVDQPGVPWAVLPQMINAMGISLVFPVLSVKMLDRYPGNRGSASSMQAFLWGVCTSLIAALMAPALAHGHRPLAVGACVLIAVGFGCWAWYARITPVPIGERNAHQVSEEPVEPG